METVLRMFHSPKWRAENLYATMRAADGCRQEIVVRHVRINLLLYVSASTAGSQMPANAAAGGICRIIMASDCKEARIAVAMTVDDMSVESFCVADDLIGNLARRWQNLRFNPPRSVRKAVSQPCRGRHYDSHGIFSCSG